HNRYPERAIPLCRLRPPSRKTEKVAAWSEEKDDCCGNGGSNPHLKRPVDVFLEITPNHEPQAVECRTSPIPAILSIAKRLRRDSEVSHELPPQNRIVVPHRNHRIALSPQTRKRPDVLQIPDLLASPGWPAVIRLMQIGS